MIMQSTLNSNNKNFVTKAVITCTPQNEGYPHSIHVQSLQYQIVCLLWEHTCTHVFRELFQPLAYYILHVPTIYSDGATYSTLALLSSILWVRSPCLPDWGLKSKSSGTVRRVASHKDTHTLTVHQKRIWWHQSKSLGLWKCWTVTWWTNGLMVCAEEWTTLNKCHSCNGITPLYNFIGCFQNLRNWACASEPNSLWELGLEFSDLWSHSQATLERALEHIELQLNY